MRRIATGDSEAEKSAVKSAPAKEKGTGSWLKVHWCIVSLAVIMVLAFVLRVVFAYGISAGDDYALSGGTSASSHLRIVIELLAGTYDPASQPQLNYPYGIESVSGPMYDYLMAGIAYLVTLFGVSDATAASGVIAWSSPIIGVLTAIPVFMLAKKIFNDDVVAILSAFIYEFTALVIMVTPFSYGSEFALLGFLAAFMVYFLVGAIKLSDERNLSGFLCVLERDVFFYAILAGIFYGLVIHTWTDFRVIAIVAAVIVAINLVVSRVRGKDMGATVGIATVFLLFGTFIGAAYYLPFGLWDDVFSGGCLIALFTVLYSVVFLLLSKKPWIVTIPLMAAVIIVVGVALHFALPDIADAIFKGNTALEPGLVEDLAESFTRSSISSMATWFGWLTVWMPLALGCYMLYRYRKDGGKRLYDFVMLWMLSMFFIGWFESGYAVLAASAMAIGAAYVLVTVLRAVDIKAYLASLKTLRGSGMKGAAKKVLTFFPFVTLVTVALLIIVPNAVYAFDAATPTNDEKSDYYGGLGYTINTSDSSELSSAWNHYGDVDKDGALLTWYGYSDSAAVFGGFDTVTSPYGNGSAALSTAMLQDGTSGALVSMTVRLLESNTSKVASAVSGSGLSGIDPAVLTKILKDNSYCDEILEGTEYADLNLDSVLRPYYAALVYLTDTCGLSATELCALYDSACKATGDKISYIEVDSSMLPVAARDNSFFSTVAYLGGYEVGADGSVSEFYTVNSYTGYAYYEDRMYNTFLYQALVGLTPAEAGMGYSIQLLSEISASDGDVKPVPAKGLTGFTVDYWHVMYNPDSEATGSDSGWTDMDAYEAIAKQNAEGGLINYLSSVMILKYTGVSATVSGTVSTGSGALAGATVNVYAKTDFDSTGAIDYILYSSSVTGEDGTYIAAIPATAFKMVMSTSAAVNSDGNVFATEYYNAGTASFSNDVVIDDATLNGDISTTTDASGVTEIDGNMVLKMQNSDIEYTFLVHDGEFGTGAFSGDPATIMPGTYDVTVTLLDGTSVGTSVLTVVPGDNEAVFVKINAYAITATVTDQADGQPAQGANVTVYNTKTLTSVNAVADEDGKAVVYVPAGNYVVYVNGSSGSITLAPSSVTVQSSAQNVSLTVVDSAQLAFTVGGDAAMAAKQAISVQGFAYSTTAVGGIAYVPSVAGVESTYFASVTIDGTTYFGSGSTGTIDLTAQDAVKVSGTVNLSDKAASGAKVVLDSDDWLATAKTDSDGKFTITVPKKDSYVMYAASGASYYIENLACTADVTDKTVDLTAGSTFDYTVNYTTGGMSPSNRAIGYAGLFTASITSDAGSYTMENLMTGSDGKVSLVLPSGYSAVMTIALTDTDYVHIGDKDGDTPTDFTSATLTSSSTFTVPRVEPATRSTSTGWSYVKTVSNVEVVCDGVGSASDYNGTIKHALDSSKTYEVVNGAIAGDVVPGAYEFELDTAIHYDGRIYIYAGLEDQTAVFASEPFVATKVVLSGVDGATVTVQKSDSDAKTDEHSSDHTYYLEKNASEGFTYTLKAVDADGKVAYAYVDADGNVSATDLTGLYAAVVKVSGNLGTDASGTLLATYGDITLRSDVTSGSYSVELPSGKDYTLSVELERTSGEKVYSYTASAPLSIPADATEDIVFNFQALTDSVGPAENDYASYVGATFTGDRVSMDIELKLPEGVSSMTMIVKGLSGLALDETYSFYLAPLSPPTVFTVDGTYNSRLYGAGSESVGVLVQDNSGNTLATLTIPASDYPAPAEPLTVKMTMASAESGVSDAVNGYSYRYAVSIENKNTEAVFITVDGSLVGAGENWSVYVSDEKSLEVWAPGHEFTVGGKTTSTYYVVAFSKADYAASDVPSINYTVSATDISGGAVTIDGTAAGTAAHATVKVEQTGGSVSDGGASDEGKTLFSSLFIGLLVVMILLILLFAWAASKRGVFSRR